MLTMIHELKYELCSTTILPKIFVTFLNIATFFGWASMTKFLKIRFSFFLPSIFFPCYSDFALIYSIVSISLIYLIYLNRTKYMIIHFTLTSSCLYIKYINYTLYSSISTSISRYTSNVVYQPHKTYKNVYH